MATFYTKKTVSHTKRAIYAETFSNSTLKKKLFK